MKGVLDKKNYYLKLIKNDTSTERMTLDTKGYGAIALIVRGNVNISDYGELTEERQLTVNNRNLRISFATSSSVGVMFELIKV